MADCRIIGICWHIYNILEHIVNFNIYNHDKESIQNDGKWCTKYRQKNQSTTSLKKAQSMMRLITCGVIWKIHYVQKKNAWWTLSLSWFQYYWWFHQPHQKILWNWRILISDIFKKWFGHAVWIIPYGVAYFVYSLNVCFWYLYIIYKITK